MSDDEREDIIPDGIPDGFDPDDRTTWGLPGPYAKRRVIRANFKQLQEGKRRPTPEMDAEPEDDAPDGNELDHNEPESPAADAYPEGWMFEDATHDVGSGRYRPLFVLFAGAAVAAMLPILPTADSTPMLIFATALVVWRLVAAFREIERSETRQRAPMGWV